MTPSVARDLMAFRRGSSNEIWVLPRDNSKEEERRFRPRRAEEIEQFVGRGRHAALKPRHLRFSEIEEVAVVPFFNIEGERVQQRRSAPLEFTAGT
jgi:hypothetical protein